MLNDVAVGQQFTQGLRRVPLLEVVGMGSSVFVEQFARLHQQRELSLCPLQGALRTSQRAEHLPTHSGKVVDLRLCAAEYHIER